MVHILCIILVVHLLVLSIIVELTKQNVQTKYYHITSPHKIGLIESTIDHLQFKYRCSKAVFTSNVGKMVTKRNIP